MNGIAKRYERPGQKWIDKRVDKRYTRLGKKGTEQ